MSPSHLLRTSLPHLPPRAKCAFVPPGRLALHSHWVPDPPNVQVTWSFVCVSLWIWIAVVVVLVRSNSGSTVLRPMCAGRW
jgi:hypothetical protein